MTEIGRLGPMFACSLGEEVRGLLARDPGLEQTLAAVLRQAREAWPGVQVPDEVFLSFLAERVQGEPYPLGALSTRCLPDLYLACACLAGVPEAASAFQDRHYPMIARAVHSLDEQRTFTEDVQQMVYERLFVGSGERGPRIAAYRGEGELGTWIRVVAVRLAQNLVRGARRTVPLESDSLLHETLKSERDPELTYLGALYQPALRAAFQSALASLSDRERNLLRLSCVEGVTQEALARSFKVHRLTLSRWLGKARSKLLKATRKRLAEALGASSSEVGSLMTVLESRLALSIRRLLEPPDAPGRGDRQVPIR
jgi:RNA polymerase sigma-70 factor (ECF subfamily)